MVFFNHTRVSPTLAPRKTPNTGPWLTTNLKGLQNLAVKRTHLSRRHGAPRGGSDIALAWVGGIWENSSKRDSICLSLSS